MLRYCILFITVMTLAGCGRQPYTTLYFAEDVTYEQAQQLIFKNTDADERLGWVYFEDAASELEYSIQPKNLLNPLRQPPATVYAVRVEIKADRASVQAMAASPLIARVERGKIWKMLEHVINRLDKLWHRTH